MIHGQPIADTDCGKGKLGEVAMGEDRATASDAEERVL